jgi:hypothetical protein
MIASSGPRPHGGAGGGVHRAAVLAQDVEQQPGAAGGVVRARQRPPRGEQRQAEPVRTVHDRLQQLDQARQPGRSP